MRSHWIVAGTSPAGFVWQGGEGVRADNGMRAAMVIGAPNFNAIWWLELALRASRSVARVKLGGGSATGFLIAPDLFLTNNHVFERKDDARNAKLQFNYRMTAEGEVAPRDEWECDPDDLFHTNPVLDYTVVRIRHQNGKPPGDKWGFLNLRHGAALNVDQRVNIIQHPQGRFQEIAFRDNQVKAVLAEELHYLTDTEHGSSGAPVFDDWFRVVALHSQRAPDPNNPFRFNRNQGHRVEAILADAGNKIP